MSTVTHAARYDYPLGGQYNETVATLSDGRVVTIDTQYACVLPHGNHKADCDQINKMGGRCTCGLLAGIDVAALVADARERTTERTNGRLGHRNNPTSYALHAQAAADKRKRAADLRAQAAGVAL